MCLGYNLINCSECCIYAIYSAGGNTVTYDIKEEMITKKIPISEANWGYTFARNNKNQGYISTLVA